MLPNCSGCAVFYWGCTCLGSISIFMLCIREMGSSAPSNIFENFSGPTACRTCFFGTHPCVLESVLAGIEQASRGSAYSVCV
jgi:hypothetical protein